MPTSKVTRNYQITIPQEIRASAEIEEGDTVTLEYDEAENRILIKLPRRGRRSTMRLGRSLTVEEIEGSIERGIRE
jgi:AbrB family looped-hinge helix DNA binding protein